MIYNAALRGIIPRLSEHLLPNGSAVKALNCNLEDGDLKPWPFPKKVCGFTSQDQTNSVHPIAPVFNNDFPCSNTVLGFKGKADLVYCPITELYIKLEDNVLYAADREEATFSDWTAIAVEKPTVPPIIKSKDGPYPRTGDPCTVFYFYTLVNKHGFESPPSPLAEGFFSVDRNDSSGFTEGFNQIEIYDHRHLGIQTVRLYRSEVGYRTGEEGASINDTAFFLIAELYDGDANYNDAYNTASTLMYEEDTNFRPPEHLENLAMMENGALIGSYQNRIHFSAPPSLRPMYNAWPGNKDLILDHDVKSIIVVRTGAFVITDGAPYFVQLTTPGEGYVYQEQKADFVAPLASKSSVVDTGDAVLYLSTKGIVTLTSPGRAQGFNAKVISHNHFSHKQWRDLDLDDAQAVALDGKYIFITRDKGYVFFYGSGSNPVKEPFIPMSELDLLGHPEDMFVDENGVVFYLKDDELFQWDLSDEDWAPYDYMSKPYEMKSCTSMTAGKIHVHGDGEAHFTLLTYNCGHPVVRKEREITDCSPFRLPSSYRSDFFGYRLNGTRTVTSVHIARGMTGLAKIPGENL